MFMPSAVRSVVAGVSFASLAVSGARATTLGTATITNATHYGYYGFASTSAQNTKATVGPFSGICRTIYVQGTITKVHPDAWVKSIRVLPSGAGLAGYQPWFQFGNQYDFTGTIPVSATIHAPGGFNLSQPLNFEMYSIDAEQFVPGIDAKSTLTYTFDDSFPAGTAQYTGTLAAGDPTFNRPIQFETNPPGYTAPFASNRFPFYDVQPFFVSAAGSYTIASANEYESAGVLYANSFNAASPLTNVVRALGQTANVLRNNTFNALPFDDDATGGTVITADLLPGVQYYYVTTAFSAPGAEPDGGPFVGRYSNIITGAGNVTLGVIPEPGTGLILMTSMCALYLRRRVPLQRDVVGRATDPSR
jgi:hypothetical protein